MGKPTGFMESGRQPPERRPIAERIRDYQELYHRWPDEKAREQGGRCMDCAVPFCHTGCPLGNVIPEFNHFVYMGDWENALRTLLSTNNFPEFTGRICPAPCEASCVLSINSDPVTIEYVEKEIADRGYEKGWIRPQPPAVRTGKRVAVVGSGPAGLAAAQQINRAGHWVTVYERAEYIGGLLALGIPDFKLDKEVLRRRLSIMEEEGITFETGVNVGVDLPTDQLLNDFDAICLACGSTQPRDLPVPGRELNGVHFAMEYLTQQNRLNAGQLVEVGDRLTAEGKRVVILGGGDTGADCLGTAHRQGAELVSQYELLAEPPVNRPSGNPWPQWPLILRSSAAHEEGGIRDYGILTKSFSGSDGKVEKLHAVRVEWSQPENGGRPEMSEVPDSEFEVETDLVLLAMGFLHPEHDGLLTQLGVDSGPTGQRQDRSRPDVQRPWCVRRRRYGARPVAGGLGHRGRRETARAVDLFLMGETNLPRSLPDIL